ncbi:GtrA family protein [Thaumasiovibrio sp. DFM-14]|uniref:GtrA family protein n=1 Tax=Thaumasiovibrio sp. DFM-14 TaxID=3384792 RepID=UPI0039A38575
MNKRRRILRQLRRFLLVGGSGFIVDSSVFLCLFYLADATALFSRLVAFAIAATVTWYGNRRFTFHSRAPELRQWAKFMLVATLSLLPNLIVFQSWLYFFGSAGLQPFFALCAGVIAGLVVNFCLNLLWVFQPHSPNRDTTL